MLRLKKICHRQNSGREEEEKEKEKKEEEEEGWLRINFKKRKEGAFFSFLFSFLLSVRHINLLTSVDGGFCLALLRLLPVLN